MDTLLELTHAAQPPENTPALQAAAQAILKHITPGLPLTTAELKTIMISAYGGSDGEGAWDWKTAYDAGEIASVLFVRKFGPAMLKRAGAPHAFLAMLEKIGKLLPTHTRRSETSQAYQQFSTPMPLAYVATVAAQVTSTDVVLEPSAGTGLLAVFAEIAGGRLVLNEIAANRRPVLEHSFPGVSVSSYDAASIHDLLSAEHTPTLVVMNPPFSVAAHVDGLVADAAMRHITSALARLAPGGRLVTITGANLHPTNPRWRAAFAAIQKTARVVFSAAIDGSAYAKHGTTFDTRLTVIDKVPSAPGNMIETALPQKHTAASLLDLVLQILPQRPEIQKPAALKSYSTAKKYTPVYRKKSALLAVPIIDAGPLLYVHKSTTDQPEGQITGAVYENYSLQSISIAGAMKHPTQLVQSAAMASVAPPKPGYVPTLPTGLVAKGLLSDAQLESIISAGEAHSATLAGTWTMDATYDIISAATADATNAVKFRRGWMLGDGTGAGKGRQAAGIILDNWLKGRRKAVWISKSDKLIDDAQRDWSSLGQERLHITPQSRFKSGTPITIQDGILFTTYATLRSEGRDDKGSRIQQIIDWLGPLFDGCIMFDESHAMANAAPTQGERGGKDASQQGRAGLRLQHALPDARVVYISATGATDVHNLAYAQRLGLWGGDDFPFATRSEFIAAIEGGGVAAMEVLARDLKAFGLYSARSLSYEGVQYELTTHELTEDQIHIYDSYAGAFEIIHNHLNQALRATNITGDSGSLNGQAKSAARSAFESSKQRFFLHLITSMKTATLIKCVRRDLDAGHASVIQIVSTSEALMERRLAEIPTSEWGDLQVDITPREYVLDYLMHSFPTALYEPFTDESGKVSSRPVIQDGNPVVCRAAVEARDALIEHLCTLTPVQGALDQIIQTFGTDTVAEVTGRSRRIVRKGHVLCVENRPGSANLSEAQAFMDDLKPILVFSDAGGTGRSYHAELSAKNQRLRVHYLLEAGWKADTAIQGLGRTNRTNQKQPPLFRPIATNVKAEKRFLSTIARRLDTLGAITKGQRETGGQGMFQAADNLESPYGRAALTQLYMLLVSGKVDGCSLEKFEAATGLKLLDKDGTFKDGLPPITTFLNRLLALTIDLQNKIFDVFEGLLRHKIEGAIASGTYDRGLETLTASSFEVSKRQTIYTHPQTGAETKALTILQRTKNEPRTLDHALDLGNEAGGKLVTNTKSKRAAVQVRAPSVTLDDGTVERRVRLIRPMDVATVSASFLEDSNWEPTDATNFAIAWTAELDQVPEYSDQELFIVTGLPLPIWKRLPSNHVKVYRLKTDAGEKIVGRVVSPAWMADIAELPDKTISPADAYAALLDGKVSVALQDGLKLRRSKVMAENRIELCEFTQSMVPRLKTMGLFSELIGWKLRMFVPSGDHGFQVLDTLAAKFPILQITPAAAATPSRP